LKDFPTKGFISSLANFLAFPQNIGFYKFWLTFLRAATS